MRQDATLQRQVLGRHERHRFGAAAPARLRRAAAWFQSATSRFGSTPRTISPRSTRSDDDLQAHYKGAGERRAVPGPRAGDDQVPRDLDSIKKRHHRARGRTAQSTTRRTRSATRRPKSATPATSREGREGAPAAEREKVTRRRPSTLAELRKGAGENFADTAPKNPRPGSAQRGGDLDFFSRGAMVKPFEDAAFRAQTGRDQRRGRERLRLPHLRSPASRGGGKKRASSRCAPRSRRGEDSRRRTVLRRPPSTSPTWSTNRPTASSRRREVRRAEQRGLAMKRTRAPNQRALAKPPSSLEGDVRSPVR